MSASTVQETINLTSIGKMPHYIMSFKEASAISAYSVKVAPIASILATDGSSCLIEVRLPNGDLAQVRTPEGFLNTAPWPEVGDYLLIDDRGNFSHMTEAAFRCEVESDDGMSFTTNTSTATSPTNDTSGTFADLATLSLSIDSSGVRSAISDLERLIGASDLAGEKMRGLTVANQAATERSAMERMIMMGGIFKAIGMSHRGDAVPSAELRALLEEVCEKVNLPLRFEMRDGVLVSVVKEVDSRDQALFGFVTDGDLGKLIVNDLDKLTAAGEKADAEMRGLIGALAAEQVTAGQLIGDAQNLDEIARLVAEVEELRGIIRFEGVLRLPTERQETGINDFLRRISTDHGTENLTSDPRDFPRVLGRVLKPGEGGVAASGIVHHVA